MQGGENCVKFEMSEVCGDYNIMIFLEFFLIYSKFHYTQLNTFEITFKLKIIKYLIKLNTYYLVI